GPGGIDAQAGGRREGQRRPGPRPRRDSGPGRFSPVRRSGPLLLLPVRDEAPRMTQGRRRAVSILGSTGSIGTQTLDLIGRFPERFEVVALAAGRNAELLARQIETHRPRLAAIADASRRELLAAAARAARCEIVAGEEGLLAVAGFPAAD